MKKIATLLLLVCCGGCATVTPHNPRPDALWPLVAKSDVIATGMLAVPVHEIRFCLESNEHKYVELTLDCESTLKGDFHSEVIIKCFTRPDYYSPSPEDIIASDGKEVTIFLKKVDGFSILDQLEKLELDISRNTPNSLSAEETDLIKQLQRMKQLEKKLAKPKSELFFAGNTPYSLNVADASLIERIQKELANQEEILRRFEELYPPKKIPKYEEVKALIEQTTQEDTQVDAFLVLEKMGMEAVPAIIVLMDDRRSLAVSSISFENAPGHWEGIRHYGPETVVDAMAAILNQITGESFGTINNGGSERARSKTVNGWRIYLHKTHNKGLQETSLTRSS